MYHLEELELRGKCSCCFEAKLRDYMKAGKHLPRYLLEAIREYRPLRPEEGRNPKPYQATPGTLVLPTRPVGTATHHTTVRPRRMLDNPDHEDDDTITSFQRWDSMRSALPTVNNTLGVVPLRRCSPRPATPPGDGRMGDLALFDALLCAAKQHSKTTTPEPEAMRTQSPEPEAMRTPPPVRLFKGFWDPMMTLPPYWPFHHAPRPLPRVRSLNLSYSTSEGSDAAATISDGMHSEHSSA